MIFVCTLFRGHDFDRTRVMRYGPEHVAVLASMLRRHGGHELWCVNDGTFGLPPSCRGVLMPDCVSRLPRYYPKLWLFSEAFGTVVGTRFAAIDLDVIVTGDLAPVLETRHDFLIWSQARGEPYNTSLFTLEPGARSQVWDLFTVASAVEAEKYARRWTGDQSWVAHVLGRGMATFGEETGVLQYRPKMHRAACPAGAVALFTCGPFRPDLEAERSAWIEEAYR